MLRKHKWKIVLLALVVATVVLISVPWSKKIPLRSGYARVTKESFVRSLFPEAYSTISYHPDHGQAGSIVLWQDAFDGPVMLMSATDTDVLLCLYDYDTCFRLLRIHTDRPFKPLPPSDDLNRILFTCTWEVESGTTSWDEVEDHLRKVSPTDFTRETVTVGVRGPNSASNLLAALVRSGGKYPWQMPNHEKPNPRSALDARTALWLHFEAHWPGASETGRQPLSIMNSLKLTPVPQGSRWPSGDSVDVAVLPITADDLSSRIGQPLVRDIEDGLGAWSGTGGRLPSGRDVEFVCYATRPEQVIVRVDKGAPYSSVLDEALQLVGLSRSDVIVNPVANG